MAKNPSFWQNNWLASWFKTSKDSRVQREYRRHKASRRRPFEMLEDRALFAVVTPDTSNFLADQPAIVIIGSGFDPIVSNNTLSFSEGAAGTVVAATETSLTVEFTTAPEAGQLMAVVTSTSGSSGVPVQVATVIPVITPNTANIAANATQIVIVGTGFDTTVGNNSVAFGNGAAGTVIDSTRTSLTVQLDTPPTVAGSLTAVVTTNGVPSDSIQVANVLPVITQQTANLAANATTLTIAGSGFGSSAGAVSVTLSNGAVGTVSAATPTSLTVDLTTPPLTAGELLAFVSVGGVNSSGQVQVATVTPVVSAGSANQPANLSTLTINGFGFDSIANNNTVTLSGGAIGVVTAATATSLTVNLTTRPTTAGDLTAAVTTRGISSGAPVVIAEVSPVVTSRNTSLAANGTEVVINGFGFSSTPADNVVTFAGGAQGNVTAASPTSLTVTFTTNPPNAGSLTANVSTLTVSSGAQVQVATVRPVVTSSIVDLGANETTVTINGFGFAATNVNNTVVFNNGATGNVTASSPTQLTVTFVNRPTTAGSLTAVVTSNLVSSGEAVQVATVTPFITTTAATLPANAATMTIAGFGFSPVASNNVVTFNNGAAGLVTSATPTLLTVTFSARPATAGDLEASVTTGGISSGAMLQVATVTPVVTASTARREANATTVVINGFGFSPTPGNNTVDFNNGATGTVISASETSLTVEFVDDPVSAGSLTAIVTTNTLTSGAAVQVATVVPVITSSVLNHDADETELVINGFGFSTVPGANLVTFDNGAIGNVTAETATSITVTFTTRPVTAGNLNALVTSNTVAASSAVQVATVVPVVSLVTDPLPASSTTVTINGFGFDPIAANNLVTFDNGAVGTVSSATPTQLTVTLSARPTTSGLLSATVVTNTRTSGALVQVATVVPSVTATPTTFVAANQTIVTITGFGFSITPSENTVAFTGGAIGNVTAATNTSLEVTLTTRPAAAGLLAASVTTNTHNSGANVSIASVRPVLLANPANTQNANVSTITIAGVGFDTTPGNNLVAFNLGAVGEVTGATPTSLTVNLTTRPTGGNLTAVVTTNGISNGTAVQVARIRPLVTSSPSPLAANADSVTINGFGFDPTAVANQVTFNNGAVGTVTSATPTTLTVAFTTRPTSAGSLTAVVTNNSVASAAPVQVANVTPVVTSSIVNRSAGETTVVINGFGFSSINANNVVTFNRDAVGTVTLASPTSLTVTFSRRPSSAGPLTASVTSNGVTSGAPVTVATIAPVITANNAYQISANASSLIINGLGFSTTPGSNLVTFNNGAIGSVEAATETQLTVALTTPPTSAGPLNATLTTNGVSGGSATLVATVAPVVTPSSTPLAANATSLTINGVGFSTTPGSNLVTFNNGAVGTVTAATVNSLTVTLSVRPTVADNLTVVVSSNGVSSGAPVQVASVIPVVTSNIANLAANATTLLINGFGFSAVPGDNLVTLSNGAQGTVTGASATTLTVSLTTRPTSSGPFTAVVTTNTRSSGDPVQVATVIPVVTSSTAILDANALTLVINGFGFSTVLGDNVVTFDNGAEGNVTLASPNSITVTFTENPVSAGPLFASVEIDGVSTAADTQVASVKPVVTLSVAPLDADAETMTIAGFGFDPDPANNSVVLSNGAVGNVIEATPTELTIELVTLPSSAGILTAVVTSNSVSSGVAVQAATVIPVITESTDVLAANANQIVIEGVGFGPTIASNTVTFNNGAIGNVTAVSTSSLTVTFTTRPLAGGTLTATVVSNGATSIADVQVAEVAPVVTPNAALQLGANATSITITGIGFATDASLNTVVLSSGAEGTVLAATPTSLTVTFDVKPQTAGALTAVVTTNGIASVAPVTVATIAPVVTPVTDTQAANADTVTITGLGFDPIAANNLVVFNRGASGTVTEATETSLTVTFTVKPTSVGVLTASVTTNGVPSGAGIQIATVVPVVTSSIATHAISADTIVINGFGFDSVASNNIVTFNRGAVGTVTNATATTLIVSFTVKPTSVGELTASVTTNTRSSGDAVAVGSVVPVVTLTTASLAANAPSITINGFGFDTTPVNNVVTFSSGATGTVSAATSTTLTVDLTSEPTAGDLTAVVLVNGISIGGPVKVATTTPVVTLSTSPLSAASNRLTILGNGFDIIAGNNTVAFSNGALGTVVSATANSLLVDFDTRPASAGSLTATVTTNGVSSPAPIQVAAVTPRVSTSNASLGINATTLEITGFGFDLTPGNNTVLLSLGAVGTVTAATATSLTVDITTPPTAAGQLTATVTSNTLSSGTPVQVASVVPVITASVDGVAANATTITIAGFGFDTTAANNRVTFNNGAVGAVTAATTTELTVTLAAKPRAGSLEATVVVNGISSSPAQVATALPALTTSTANLSAGGVRITVAGAGFDPVAANNSITLDNGAVGTVVAATPTLLTVNLTSRPTAKGALRASVTSNGISSGPLVQIASVTPSVTRTTTNVSLTASSMLINGFAFDPVAVNNQVVLSNGAVGTVTEATPTQLTVALSTPPSAGVLTAVVTSDGVSSGEPIQVGSVAPTIVTRTASFNPSSTTFQIFGSGFSTTAADNTVTFSNGAVGTVRAALPNRLTVTLNTRPTAGVLTVVVRTNGVNSASTQVATVSPTVTSSTGRLSLNGTRLMIRGAGFDTTAANNTVVLSRGAVGTVTSASQTTLVVTLTTDPTSAGPLTAVVTTNGRSSGTAIPVAQVVSDAPAPVVTRDVTVRAANAPSIVITGTGFSPAAANNVVTFSSGAVGVVTSATATSLTVSFITRPVAGNLTAVVSTNGVVSGPAVQVASVIPVVSSRNVSLPADESTVTINGFGFDPVATNNRVTFNNGAVGNVTQATPTSLTVRFTTRPTTSADLTAVVTTNSRPSASAVQVANVVPAVRESSAGVGINAATMVINGFGFSPTAGNNSVVLSNGAVGTVTSATPTRLTVTFGTQPQALGEITATVTSNTRSSGTPVAVASAVPMVTTSNAPLAADASTITINGFGFDPIAANNVVSFNNGAVGVVTAATTTTLAVSFAVKPTAGNLRASVTTNGFASGSSVQVALVTPVVTASTTQVAANSLTHTFTGYGFSSTPAANVVTFNGGVTGTVTASTPTSLTVRFNSRPQVPGSLTAVVTTSGASSGAAVPIADVAPVVTTRNDAIAANAGTLIIRGFGFDTTAANNTVTFSNGAAGTVAEATARLLTVTLTTPPQTAGSLEASVTVGGVTGESVEVATVRPVVTSSTASLLLNTPTMVINGLAFDTIASNNVVVFNNGAAGTVISSTPTTLLVSFDDLPPSGNLTAIVTTNGVSSGAAVQVATVAGSVTTSTANLAADASGITITGTGFDPVAANNTVQFNNGAIGTVTAATTTSLTINFTRRPTSSGSLTAVVTTNGAASGTPTQVATVTPVVRETATTLGINSPTVFVNGFGFGTDAAGNQVVLGNGAVGTVTVATPTRLTVTLSTPPTALGPITAVVTSNSVSSGAPVEVATVSPAVTNSTASLPFTANTLTINGAGFSTTAADNTVVFSNGAVGTVASATATSLVVNFSVRPTAGNLTAVVTTNGFSSGTPVQVRTLTPIITSATTDLAANATTVIINGTGFDSVASRNRVVFNNGAVGNVVSATATRLTVTLTTRPTSAGPLTAVVTTNGVANATPVQVARVTPVVTQRASSLARTADTIVINGFGFNPVAPGNTVTFNNGATGTISSATATSLTVTFVNKPVAAGLLTAVVTTNGISSGNAIQVATMT